MFDWGEGVKQKRATTLSNDHPFSSLLEKLVYILNAFSTLSFVVVLLSKPIKALINGSTFFGRLDPNEIFIPKVKKKVSFFVRSDIEFIPDTCQSSREMQVLVM